MFNFSSGAHLSQVSIVLHSVKGAFQIFFSHLHGTTLCFTEFVLYVFSFLLLFPMCMTHSHRSLYRKGYSWHIGFKTSIFHLSNQVKYYIALCYKLFFTIKREQCKRRNSISADMLWEWPGTLGVALFFCSNSYSPLSFWKFKYSGEYLYLMNINIHRIYLSVFKGANCQETNVYRWISQFLFEVLEKQEWGSQTWFLLPFLPVLFSIRNHSTLSNSLAPAHFIF